MNIEVGKSYRTRDGRKATVVDEQASRYPWDAQIGEEYYAYTDNGRVSLHDESRHDLVSPWVDEPAADYCYKPAAVATAIAVLRARAIAHASTLPMTHPTPRAGQVWRTDDGYGGYEMLVAHDGRYTATGLASGYWWCELNDDLASVIDGLVYIAPSLPAFLASDEGKAWLERFEEDAA